MLCGTITSLILQMPAFKTRRSATADGTRDTIAYISQIVSRPISQVIGCEDRLQNDLYCVEWGVKLYSNQPTMSVKIKWTEQNITQYLLCIHYRHCIYAFCSVLWPPSIRGLATPWTYFLHLSLSPVILIDFSSGIPVRVFLWVRGLEWNSIPTAALCTTVQRQH